MPNIIKYGKYCITFSILITLIGIGVFIYYGITTGEPLVMDIDFKGGNIIEVDLGQTYNNSDVEELVKETVGVQAIIQKLGTEQQKVSIKTPALSAEDSNKIVSALKDKYNLEKDVTKLAEKNQKVEPAIGKEIWQKGLMAMLVSAVLIMMYIALRFRIMSGFSAGTTAVIALLHDAFIMFAVYSLLRIPINSSFVAAVLTILGYSINDTIIIYDRIRENQKILKKMDRAELVNKSILQTLTRSINTVVTVLICVVTLYIFGNIYGIQSIKEFTLPLIVGLIIGAYSSIFIASPLWVWWKDRTDATKAKKLKGTKTKLA